MPESNIQALNSRIPGSPESWPLESLPSREDVGHRMKMDACPFPSPIKSNVAQSAPGSFGEGHSRQERLARMDEVERLLQIWTAIYTSEEWKSEHFS